MSAPRGRQAAEWIVGEADKADREAVIASEPRAVRPAATDATDRVVEVEWVGERCFLEDPRVEFMLLREGLPGGFTPHQAAVIRAASKVRIAKVPNHSREMTADRDGLSQDYVWGPAAKTYVRRMPFADADKLKSCASGHEFRVLGHEPEPSPLRLPEMHVRLVGEREFDRIETLAGLRGGAVRA